MGGLAPPSPGETGVLSFLNYDSRVIILNKFILLIIIREWADLHRHLRARPVFSTV